MLRQTRHLTSSSSTFKRSLIQNKTTTTTHLFQAKRTVFTLPRLTWDSQTMGIPGLYSPETFENHYKDVHGEHVKQLNRLIEGTEFDTAPLDKVMLHTWADSKFAPIFWHAAEHWNHTFFWALLEPDRHQQLMSQQLYEDVKEQFGSVNSLQEEFVQAAVQHFGSGWAWLVLDDKQKLRVMTTSNHLTPSVIGYVPLLALDLWEHAYYLEWQNRREAYARRFWQVINWRFVNETYHGAIGEM